MFSVCSWEAKLHGKDRGLKVGFFSPCDDSIRQRISSDVSNTIIANPHKSAIRILHRVIVHSPCENNKRTRRFPPERRVLDYVRDFAKLSWRKVPQCLANDILVIGISNVFIFLNWYSTVLYRPENIVSMWEAAMRSLRLLNAPASEDRFLNVFFPCDYSIWQRISSDVSNIIIATPHNSAIPSAYCTALLCTRKMWKQ